MQHAKRYILDIYPKKSYNKGVISENLNYVKSFVAVTWPHLKRLCSAGRAIA